MTDAVPPFHLSEIAARCPDKPAVIHAGTGAVTTYVDLDRRSLQVAQLLAAHGLGPGDHIAIMMDNRPEYLEVFWGAQRRGIYTTPVNWHLTEHEAAIVVADCGARVLFTSSPLAASVQLVTAMIDDPPVTYVVQGEGDQSYEAARDAQPSQALLEETEGIYFFYSSGTTGVPKGIKPEHAFPPFGTGLPVEALMRDSFGFSPDTVYLCPAPLYHAAPLGWSVGATRNQGTVVLMDRFDAIACLQAIERYRVTHAQFVPTMFVRMLKLERAERESHDVSSLQVVVHASAPCPIDVKQQMIDWFGPKLLEFYAGSEGSGMTMISSRDWLTHQGSVGRAVLGNIHIVGPSGDEVPAGEIGSVYFGGGGTFEYHGDPEKTAAAHNVHGWSTLGDLGHVDPDGYLYLADRRSDLIISGGVNIYPREVEEALVMHPSVTDIAVIGVPDPEMGQRVLAVVQLAPDLVPSDEVQAALDGHARSRLAAFKCPRQWEFVDTLPRTDAGKLLRRSLHADRQSFASRSLG